MKIKTLNELSNKPVEKQFNHSDIDYESEIDYSNYGKRRMDYGYPSLKDLDDDDYSDCPNCMYDDSINCTCKRNGLWGY